MINTLLKIWLLAFVTMVAGCKEVLYSDLPEIQANDMVAVLASAGISSSRERDKDNIYAVLVDGSQIAAAVTVLKNHGLPRETFKTLGDVFSADGIVGTPFEERARFVHAMNEELSHTISEISGIRTARVLIMLPEVTRYRTVEDPARASVTIHVETDFSEADFVPTIKKLVSHSIANLDYENVAVATFPVGGPVVSATRNTAGGFPAEASDAAALSVLNLRVADGQRLVRLDLVVMAIAGLLVAWGLLGGLVRRMRWRWGRNA